MKGVGNMNEYTDELKFVKNKLENEYGYKVGYIALQGSQNYGLDINIEGYQSDIDMKAIIIPTLSDLVNNSKLVSKNIDIMERLSDDRYLIEKVDVKDIRHYMNIMKKGNPSYLEPMFSDYYLIDEEFKSEFNMIRDNMECFTYSVRDLMIKAIYGMAKEKEHGLTHRYPSKEHLIDEYGYDSKQIMHISRLKIFVSKYYGYYKRDTNYNFKEAIFIEGDEFLYRYLMKIKTYFYSLKVIKEKCGWYIDSLSYHRKEILNNIDSSNIDRSIQDRYDFICTKIIKNKIKKELKEEEL